MSMHRLLAEISSDVYWRPSRSSLGKLSNEFSKIFQILSFSIRNPLFAGTVALRIQFLLKKAIFE